MFHVKHPRWRTAALFVTACLMAAAALSGAQPARATAYTFDDEFSQAAGTQPSSTLWTIVSNNARSTRTDVQCYESSAVAEDGAGHLVITALSAPGTNCNGVTEQYTSGRLETSGKFSQKYGTFSMSAKVPTAKGMFPAYWMVGTQNNTLGDPCDGEIDITEGTGSDAGRKWAEGNIHGPYTAGNCPAAFYSDGGTWNSATDLSAAYHTYSVTWAAGSLTFKADGTTFWTITSATLPAGQNWVFGTDPEWMLLNLAVGGAWAGQPDTAGPWKMYVDWVHVTAT